MFIFILFPTSHDLHTAMEDLSVDGWPALKQRARTGQRETRGNFVIPSSERTM